MSSAIQVQTRLKVADNSGAKEVMCIRILGNSWQRAAGIGDVIIAAVKKVAPNSNVVKKGDVVRCVIVRTKRQHRRKDGTYVRFNDNAVVIIKDDNNPKATRVFGCIPNELKNGYPKIVSLAEEVL